MALVFNLSMTCSVMTVMAVVVPESSNFPNIWGGLAYSRDLNSGQLFGASGIDSVTNEMKEVALLV